MLSPLSLAIPFALIQARQTVIKPVVELRTRFDRRLDKDLSDAVDDNRSALESRARIGFDFVDGEQISGKFRWQYAHTLAWSPKGNGSDESSDLYFGYIDVKTPHGTWSIGRQPIHFGASRVFEESNFGQRSKSHDLVKFHNNRYDAFAGKVGYTGNQSDQARLIGGAIRWAGGESLAYFKHDQWVTNADFWTIDHRWHSKFANGDYELEGAIQRGRNSGLDVDSFWLHGRVNVSLNPKTKVYLEGNIASGGQDATKTRRYDARYGTPHSTLGLVDVQGMTNVRHLELGLSYKAKPNLEYSASFHKFYLYDKTDGWFGGTSINNRPGGQFIDPTGASGNDVGSELNFAVKWDLTKLDTIALESGVFFPGNFVRALTAGNTRNQLWGMLSYTRKF